VTDLYADQEVIGRSDDWRHVAVEVSRTGETATLDGGQDGARNREWIARTDADQEVKRLQEKVSLLAMQKSYWRQRSAEHLNACRAAEAEVTRINEALAESKARLEVTRDVGEAQVPLTVPSF
jgi:hypothetical protein